MVVVYARTRNSDQKCGWCGEELLAPDTSEIHLWCCTNCGWPVRLDPIGPMPIDLVEKYLSSLVVA